MLRFISDPIRAAVQAIRSLGRPPAYDHRMHSVPSAWVRYLHHPQVAGSDWAVEAEQILEDNTRLAQASLYTQNLLVDRPWRWMKPRDTDRAIRNADFLNRTCGLAGQPRLMDRPFHLVLEPFARSIDCGWRLGEVDYHTRWNAETKSWETYVRDVFDIRATHVQGWDWSPDGRHVEWARLLDGRRVPLEKCVHVRHRPQGEDPEGDLGRLYACRRLHKAAMLVQDLLMVGIEQWALQIPAIEVDYEGENVYGAVRFQQMIDEAFETARAFVAREESALLHGRYLKLSTYGGPNGFRPLDLVEVHRFLDDLGLAAYMAGALALGSNQTGAKNVADFLESGTMTMLSAMGRSVGAAFSSRRRHERAFLRTLDLTFGPQDPLDYPELQPEGLDEERIARLLNVLPHWLAADAPTRVPNVWRALVRYGGVDPDIEEEARAHVENKRTRPLHLPNLDPSAGGLPARPGAAA